MRYSIILCSLLAVLYTAGPPALAEIIQSTFDTGLDGWSGITGNDPSAEVTWGPTGGNPGGYARFENDSPETTDFWAPPKFLGDWSAGNGVGLIAFDLKIFTDEPQSGVQLIFGGYSGVATWVSSIPAGPTDWMHFEVPLEPSHWFVFGTWAGALSDVQGFVVQADADTSPDAVIGLDNVIVTIPEPTTLWLLAAALAAARRRLG